MFANEVVLNINIFGTGVIDRVTSKYNIALVISKKNSNSYLWKTHFLQQCSELNSLFCNIC